jgi:TonB-dependent receptor
MSRVIRRWALLASVAVVALVLCIGAPAWAQEAAGVIAGRVLDGETKEPLPGARVTLEGHVVVASTDRTGAFRLAGVPAGAHILIVSYLGRPGERAAVTVTAGQTLTLEVAMRPDEYRHAETVTVAVEPIRDAQARALNQQRTAPNITNIVSADQIGQFPDTNAAETAQRIPGISIARDQGEGRYVLVRGMESRLNSMLIDGERIPSPEAEERSVNLDVIPADLLQAIEVSKALTPDMDGDAIGGAVNLVMKQAPEETRLLATVAGGFNNLQDTFGQGNFNLTLGRRFADNKLGVIVSGSATNRNFGSDNFEPDYDDGLLDELQVRDYTLNRRRYGLNSAVDVRLSNDSSLLFRGVFNSFRDHEYRRSLIYNVGSRRIDRNLKDRIETQHIASLTGGGRHLLGQRYEFDYRVSVSYADEDQAADVETFFRQSNVVFSPNVTPALIDPDNVQANPLNEDPAAYRMRLQDYNDEYTTDRDLVLSMNLRAPLRSTPGLAGFLKFGGKYRDKAKDRTGGALLLDPAADIRLSDFADTSFSSGTFLGGRYDPGPFVNPAQALTFRSRFNLSGEIDPEAPLANFDATENVAAGYVMGELHLGPKLFVLPGVRYERTSFEYVGNTVAFDEDGDFAGASPAGGTGRYATLLPGLHVRYALTPATNVRTALTRTLARPNYYDLVPYELVIAEDREAEIGNPDLQPTRAWNVDFMFEHYLQSVGILSAGVFYKSLRDYIFPFTFEEVRNGEDYRVEQPQNGESASIFGLEFAAQSQLTFLPAPFNGLGIYANYTFSDSEAVFPGADGRRATLPGQARHVGNVAISYEKRGFSGRVSVNFHGSYLDDVGVDALDDEYYDTHRQVDVSFSQRIQRGVRVFVDLNNLSNAPLRYYRGVWNRVIQEEYYSWSSSFGVKLSF